MFAVFAQGYEIFQGLLVGSSVQEMFFGVIVAE